MERWSDLLNQSSIGRMICWMAMQWETLSGEDLPRASQNLNSAWGEGGDQVLPDPTQPSGCGILDVSLQIPLVAHMLPQCQHRECVMATPCPSWGNLPLLPCSIPCTPAWEKGQCVVPWSAPAVLGNGEGRVQEPGHHGALGCCPQGWCPSGTAPVPQLSWPGQVSLVIFSSKMLFSCEKAKGGCGRGSKAAAIGQLLPQMVPAWLQPPGPAASWGVSTGPPSQHDPHWEPPLVPELMP